MAKRENSAWHSCYPWWRKMKINFKLKHYNIIWRFILPEFCILRKWTIRFISLQMICKQFYLFEFNYFWWEFGDEPEKSNKKKFFSSLSERSPTSVYISIAETRGLSSRCLKLNLFCHRSGFHSPLTYISSQNLENSMNVSNSI